MTTRTLSTVDGTLAWDDVTAGDRVQVGDLSFSVGEGEHYGIRLERNSLACIYSEPGLKFLGAEAFREVPEHPHGLLPEELNAVVCIHHYIYVHVSAVPSVWLDTNSGAKYTDGEAQQIADTYGFTVYGPIREGDI